jgi:FixJ family two-component response regulator/AraC-like DNA-binding protein
MSEIPGPRAAAIAVPVLWIDDEIHPDDPIVHLLILQGFRVDCAVSGAAGIAKATSHQYAVVVLDLRLPDIPGLDLVAQLVRHAPVAVLTGHGDIESAVTAMKRGAAEFIRKPVLADELAAALLSIIHSAGHARIPTLADQERDEGREVSALIDRLTTISLRPRFCGALLVAIVTARLPLAAFLVCVAELRREMVASSTPSDEDLAARVRETIGRLQRARLGTPHAKVAAALAKLEACIQSHTRPREATLASELGLDASHLGRLLRSHTGLGFREWRRAIAMRHAVRRLVRPDLQIAEIAYGVGFDHPSQFDREFRHFFGASPKRLRRFFHATAQTESDVPHIWGP